jgi:uncharacterized protein YybS (DUF2232 family)
MSNKLQMGDAMNRLVSAVIGTLLSSILFSAYILIPPAGLILGLLAPFPAILSRLRFGRGTALIVTLAATTLLTLVFEAQAGILYLVQCGVIALLLPEFLLRDFGAARSIAWTTAVNLVLYTVVAMAIIFINDQSPSQIHGMVLSEINASISHALAFYEKADIKADDLVALKQSLTSAANLLMRIYPALATLLLIIMAGFNLALVKRYSLRFDIKVKIDEFRHYRNPDLLVWVLIAAGFAMLSDLSLLAAPALNVLVVLGALYFLQGMAVIFSLLFRFGSAAALRVMLYLLLIVQPYVAALVAAIGVFDLWGDFRTPRKQENL